MTYNVFGGALNALNCTSLINSHVLKHNRFHGSLPCRVQTDAECYQIFFNGRASRGRTPRVGGGPRVTPFRG